MLIPYETFTFEEGFFWRSFCNFIDEGMGFHGVEALAEVFCACIHFIFFIPLYQPIFELFEAWLKHNPIEDCWCRQKDEICHLLDCWFIFLAVHDVSSVPLYIFLIPLFSSCLRLFLRFVWGSISEISVAASFYFQQFRSRTNSIQSLFQKVVYLFLGAKQFHLHLPNIHLDL